MKIQLNTDNNIQADPSVVRHVEVAVDSNLSRYGQQVTRVEVHLRDTNAGKAGAHDKYCLMEARLEGRPPVTASAEAESVAAAVNATAKKLQRVLDSTLGKLG